jgi:hypothetical protein
MDFPMSRAVRHALAKLAASPRSRAEVRLSGGIVARREPERANIKK